MIFFVIILFIISGFCLFLGINILLEKPGRSVHTLFFIKTIVIFIYLVSSAMIQLINDKNIIVLLDKITTCCVSVIVTLLVHLTLTLTLRNRPKPMSFVIYIPLALVIPLVALDSNFISEVSRVYDFNLPVENFGNPAFLLFAVHMDAAFLTTIVLLFRWVKKAATFKEKNQGKILLIFLLGFVAAVHITDILLPALEIFLTPHLDAFFVTIYISGFYYSIRKYNLFKFNINKLFEDIILNMQDMLIILSPDLKIIRANKKSLDTLSVREEELTGLPFTRIISADDRFESNLLKIVSGQTQNFNYRLNYLKGQENILTDSNLSRITDRFGDYAGIIVMSRENFSLKLFKERYRLSGRQIEIILLLCAGGLTNAEIAARLALKRRTVESHLFSIYSKMNIKNKAELLIAAAEYHLI